MTCEKTIKAVIGETLAILDEEGAWTQEEDALDTCGMPVFFDNPHAECWCLAGAMRLATKKVLSIIGDTRWYYQVDEVFLHAMKVVHEHLPESKHEDAIDDCAAALVIWNDEPGRRHIEVVELLQAAAA